MANPELDPEFVGHLDESERAFVDIWAHCAPYTMTSPERGLALFRATAYIAQRNIPGAIVECGTWRGGSAMIAMMTLSLHGSATRPVYVFDTFEGMTEPSDEDVDLHGRAARDLLEEGNPETSLIWARSGIDEVRAAFATTGYAEENIQLVRGDVRQTLGRTKTGMIALLRLDTDFYDSTLAELKHLYPRLLQHGVLIIDDYGHWQGCRKAVDQYFRTSPGEAGNRPIRPFLHEIDYTGRLGIRSEGNPPANVERYDYVPRGLQVPNLIPHFPTLMETDPSTVSWPYLRKSIPHIWRTDIRSSKPYIGVLSLEEAVILYNGALPFSGLRGLEIGCHLGWSTAHLAHAGLDLDVVDPALGSPEHLRHVSESVRASAPDANVNLWPGFSPNLLPAVAEHDPRPWSFAFIDGNHDGTAPLDDTINVVPHCADTCAIVFHDLSSPAVAAGIQHLHLQGWNTRIYNTMQIMGIAWRGNYEPPKHERDINVPERLPAHLNFAGP